MTLIFSDIQINVPVVPSPLRPQDEVSVRTPISLGLFISSTTVESSLLCPTYGPWTFFFLISCVPSTGSCLFTRIKFSPNSGCTPGDCKKKKWSCRFENIQVKNHHLCNELLLSLFVTVNLTLTSPRPVEWSLDSL